MDDERLERLESRVDKIEEAIIDLRINLGSLVSEMKSLRYAILLVAAAFLGVDMSGVVQ